MSYHYYIIFAIVTTFDSFERKMTLLNIREVRDTIGGQTILQSNS